MDVGQFLERTVEGYLFADLDEMAKIRVNGDGNCSYPMLMSVLSGIELLGTITYHSSLLGKATKKTGCCRDSETVPIGNPQFGWYWSYFLCQAIPDRYGKRGELTDLIRSLVRNGLAHAFIAKGIEVKKFRPDCHMKSSSASSLVIDCTTLAEDFKQSYWKGVRPILEGKPAVIKAYTISRESMQARLNELASAYKHEVTTYFGQLADKNFTIPATQVVDTTGSYNLPSPGTAIPFD